MGECYDSPWPSGHSINQASRIDFLFDRISKIEKERSDIVTLQLEVAFLKDQVRMLTEIVYKIKDLL